MSKLIVREITTKRWDTEEIIASPHYGTIERVHVKEENRIYEWEPLFVIKTEKETLEKLSVCDSGIITSINVKKGEKIVPGTVLAQMKSDSFVSGSD